MPPGKMAAQAGHAFLDVFLVAQRDNPQLAQAYDGTKVVLSCRDQLDLDRAYEAALAAGVPASLIIDSQHILPPHFDGNPIATALGIGPATHADVRAILKRFPTL